MCCVQLTDVLRDFFKQTEHKVPEAEQQFRYFLQERAVRCLILF